MYTTLTIKIDKKLKMDAQRMARQMGISLTTVVVALLKQFVRDGGINLSVNPTSRHDRYAAMARDEALTNKRKEMGRNI
ncbi:MAG TPA: hypothetical protein VI483_01725 [Candidatus Paceibacterota bacterium]